MIRLKNLSALLLAVTFSCLSYVSVAQFSGGARAGVNLANLRGSSVVNKSMLIGYNVGGFINYGLADLVSGDIGEMLSVQAELSVQTKGTKADFVFYEINSENIVDIDTLKGVPQNFSYFQVPVVAKATFGEPKGIKYFGELGFFLASLTGVTIDGQKSRNNDGDSSTDKRKFREEYAGFDYGMVIGAGASIPCGGRKSPWSAFGSIRYSMGFANIGEYKEKTVDIPVTQLADIKTSTISILFGVAYKFSLD
ncbi:MAG: porin family protein [Bacteroidales bacterium]